VFDFIDATLDVLDGATLDVAVLPCETTGPLTGPPEPANVHVSTTVDPNAELVST
jgi:hypothetical protein